MVLTARHAAAAMILGVLVAAADAGTTGQPARTGSIRGLLDIRRLTPPAHPRPGVGDLGSRPRPALPDVRRGLVYLDVAPRGAFDDGDPPNAVMDQRNETFVPRLLAIQTGASVSFPNSDATFHNVFSLSRPKRFDLGRYAAGKTKSVRFDRPGVVRVFCDIHSHMSAYIVVFNHPFFSVTDTEGRFRIDDVPPGSYTLIGWYEGEARTRHAVNVVAGAAADVEMVVP